MTASTVYTPGAIDIAHGLALEEDAARSAPPPSPAERERAEYIAGLLALAELLSTRPEVPLPYDGHDTAMSFYFLSASDPRAELAAAARAFPCSWSKSVRNDDDGGGVFHLSGRLHGLKVQLTAYRDAVCRRVVVGTEDRVVDEIVEPAVTRKVTKPVDIVEWVCEPVMAPAGTDVAA